MKFSVLIMILIFLIACDKREDIYKIDNVAPVLEVSSSATIKTSSLELLSDSFNYAARDYFINFTIIDDTKNVSLIYTVDKNASIELISESTTTVKDKFITTGVLKITPINLGIHTINLSATDPYQQQKNISILLRVYKINMTPTLRITTRLNVGSNNNGFVNTAIKDTFNLAQGNIFIEYELIDDNSNYSFNFSSTNNGILFEDFPSQNTNSLTYSIKVTGKLILTPTQTGNHLINLIATDDIGQNTQINAQIFIQ